MSDITMTAKDAAERNAAAVASGNLNQVLADISPDVIAKLMQLGAQMGNIAATPATMPTIDHYSIESVGTKGEDEVFRTTFTSALGSATADATWRLVTGQWKIVDLEVVSIVRNDTPASPNEAGGTAPAS